MEIKRISPELSVSPQLGVADVGIAASQGFRSIVCNRPDAEGDGQPPSAEIRQAAEALQRTTNAVKKLHARAIACLAKAMGSPQES